MQRETALAWRNEFLALVRVGTLLSVGFTWGGLISQDQWIPELLCHFRVQYALILIVFCLIATWAAVEPLEKDRNPSKLKRIYSIVELGVCAFSLALNLVLICQLLIPAETKPRDTAGLRLLQLNVNTHNQLYDDVANIVLKENVDIAAFQEVDENWCKQLAERLPGYPHRVCRWRQDNFGVALFSKLPWNKSNILYYGSARVPTAIATANYDGAPITVLCTHPVPPSSPDYLRMRNDQFEVMARERASWGKSVVLLGDLNSTSWSSHFSRLCKSADLLDSRQGYGVQPSWPSQAIPLLIPLDHCLLSRDLAVKSRHVCPSVGSDHYPVYIEITRAQAQSQ